MLQYARALGSQHAIAAIPFVFLLLGVQYTDENNCKPLMSPYKGELSGDCDDVTSDGICVVSCPAPYKLLGPQRRICNRSTLSWQPEKDQMCVDERLKCNRIKPPSNGYFLGECRSSVGYMCKIGCLAGYELVGSQYRYCIDLKVWEPKQPKCLKLRCPVLVVPEDGSLVGSCRNLVGYTCHFHCNAGYHLFGSYKRRCLPTGRWSGMPATCMKQCPNIPPVADGEVRGDCSPGVPGRKCNVACRRGFRLENGGRFLICQSNGTWSAHPPMCKRVECPPLLAPANGFIYGNCNPSYYGRPCIFSCKTGHFLDGRRSATCKAGGDWSSSVPVCSKELRRDDTYCSIVEPGATYNLSGTCKNAVPGDWCHVQCLVGESRDAKNLTCLENRGWSSSILTCTSNARCKRPKRPKNGYLQNCQREVGKVCEQYCNQGFASIGTSYRLCMPNGQWDGRRLKCYKYKSKYQVPNPFQSLFDKSVT